MTRVVDRIFGTEIALIGLPPEGQAWTFTVLRSMDRVFSRFRPDSELSAVNRAAGNWVGVSPFLLAALDAACQHAARTAGIFSPLLGVEVAATGYRTDFDAHSRWRSRPLPPQSAPFVIEIDHDDRRVRTGPGTAIDLDGFAKGWLGQQLAEQLEISGVARGLIDLGGDIVAWGQTGDPPWRIALAPEPGKLEPTEIDLGPRGAVATSSTLRRSWVGADGKRRHPTIDPRTGAPSDSDLVSSTVVADDLTAAEVEATRALILGSAHTPDVALVRGWVTLDQRGALRSGGSLA